MEPNVRQMIAKPYLIKAVLAPFLILAVLAGSGGSVAGMSQRAESDEPLHAFVSVSAGLDFACAVQSEGKLICWGDKYGRNTFTSEVMQGNSFVSVSAGGHHVCGIQTNGAVACHGGDWCHRRY